MQMVKFENGVISDFIDTDQPGHFIELGYVEIRPEHDSVQDIRMLKPDWTVRTAEEMYEIGAWVRPEESEEKPDEIEPVPLNYEEKVKTVDTARRIAYADPLTGSDRLFAQYQRMLAMDEPGADDIKAQAIARYDAIRNEHPWPAPDL